MQDIIHSSQDEKLFQIWQSFVTTGQLHPEEAAVLNPIILQSWQRCSPRLNPYGPPRLTKLKEPLLNTLLKAQERLITTAVTYLEGTYELIRDINYAFLLADRAGCVLSVSGDPAMIAHVNELGLGAGTFWSEGQLGTNAIGVTLKTARQAEVFGAEHYLVVYHHLTTIAAPIYEIDGRVLGYLGMVGRVSHANPQALALATNITRAIENQLQFDHFREKANHHLKEIHTLLETVPEGIVMWDNEERIHHINRQAGQILRLNPTAVSGQRLTQALELPSIVTEAVRQKRTLLDVDTNIRVNGYTIQAVVNLRPIARDANKPAGYVMSLRSKSAAKSSLTRFKTPVSLNHLTAESMVMKKVLRQLRSAGRGKAPILLQGEGGAGKSHLAEAIHHESEYAQGPFISINCRAIPHKLMVDELLGYAGEDGNGRVSKFELANGGTLLLGQIDGLSLEAQSALLHVVETGRVMRIGSAHPISVDVRIIGTTSTDLEKEVIQEHFLRPLYYYWSIFNIRIPPLRERVEDIPLIVKQYLVRMKDQLNRDFWIEDEALSVLCRYPWPGNVRELEHALERAVYHCQDGRITLFDLPEVVRSGRILVKNTPQPQPLLSTAEAEREAIMQAGFACQGNITEMINYLGISRTTLWRKMRQFDITAEYFKR